VFERNTHLDDQTVVAQCCMKEQNNDLYFIKEQMKKFKLVKEK
jgi:hypothetical protein